MPSNEITWALYGMAIVAAPTVAVWLWRRLGRRKRHKRHKLGREVAPGWHMDSDDSTVGDMRIEPAPYSESAKALGSKVPESHEVWATRQLEKLGALCHENERRLDALEAKEPEAGRGDGICELCCGLGYEIIDCGYDGFRGFRPLNCPRCKGSGRHRG